MKFIPAFFVVLVSNYTLNTSGEIIWNLYRSGAEPYKIVAFFQPEELCCFRFYSCLCFKERFSVSLAVILDNFFLLS